MHSLSLLLFSFSANLDNVVIGISYGIKKIHIPFPSIFLIGLLTSAGTLLSMLLGRSLLPFLPAGFAELSGSFLLIFIGIICLFRYFAQRRKAEDPLHWPQKNPEKFDKDHSNQIDLREAMALGLALTINNIGVGIGASMMGMPMLAAFLCSLGMSILLLYIGNFIGRSWLSRVMGSYAEPVSALVIIALGVYEMFI